MNNLCEVCNRNFATTRGLKIHTSRNHSKKNENDLETESSKVKSPGIAASKHFKCPNCPKKFPKYKAFQSHLCSHLNFCDYICKQCMMSFKSEELLKIHIKCDHIGNVYCCTICGKKFYKYMALQHHKEEHESQPPFLCAYCNSSFSSFSKRIRHMRLHITKCPICRVPMNGRDILAHCMEIHGDDDVSIRDSSSEEEMIENEGNTMKDLNASDYFRSKSSSETENVSSSSKQKPCVTCFICDEKVLKRSLQYHMQSHNVYECPICGKFFSSELKFNKHKKKHAKESSSSVQPSDEATAIPAQVINDNLVINSGGQEITKSGMNSQNLKTDATVSCKFDLFSWSMELEKICKENFVLDQELCQSIDEVVEELNFKLDNNLIHENRDICVQILQRLKNLLKINAIEKHK